MLEIRLCCKIKSTKGGDQEFVQLGGASHLWVSRADHVTLVLFGLLEPV